MKSTLFHQEDVAHVKEHATPLSNFPACLASHLQIANMSNLWNSQVGRADARWRIKPLSLQRWTAVSFWPQHTDTLFSSVLS